MTTAGDTAAAQPAVVKAADERLRSKKRFIGPISKSLLRNRKNAGILLVSLAKGAWISCPNGTLRAIFSAFREAHPKPRRYTGSLKPGRETIKFSPGSFSAASYGRLFERRRNRRGPTPVKEGALPGASRNSAARSGWCPRTRRAQSSRGAGVSCSLAKAAGDGRRD